MNANRQKRMQVNGPIGLAVPVAIKHRWQQSWGHRQLGLTALTMRKTMMVATSGVQLVAARKTARRNCHKCTVVVMSGLKMKNSMKIIYLGSWTG